MARKVISGKKKISDIGFPNMKGVFQEWETDIELIQRLQTIQDGFHTTQEVVHNVRAVVQPLEASVILVKPEALRERRWINVYIEITSVVIRTNDMIVYDGDRYRVESILDFTKGHFCKYHAVLEEGIV